MVDYSCCSSASSFSDRSELTVKEAWRLVGSYELNKILTEMAPTNHKMKAKKPFAKSGNPKFTKGNAQDMKKKRKWVPEQKVFKGNIKEGTFSHTKLSFDAVTLFLCDVKIRLCKLSFFVQGLLKRKQHK